jgi:hypothetical protein
MSKPPDLSECLFDPHNRPLSQAQCKRLKLTPHRAVFNGQHEWLLVFLKKGTGVDYSTNVEMVENVCQMVQDGKIRQGWLVQRDGDKIIKWETVKTVKKKINGAPVRQGEFGPYVWLQEGTFEPTTGSPAAWRDNELPF